MLDCATRRRKRQQAVQKRMKELQRATYRNGRVHELHVAILVLTSLLLGIREAEGVVVTKLEETFDTSRTVFGSLSIVSVGKGHDETGTLEPLLLA